MSRTLHLHHPFSFQVSCGSFRYSSDAAYASSQSHRDRRRSISHPYGPPLYTLNKTPSDDLNNKSAKPSDRAYHKVDTLYNPRPRNSNLAVYYLVPLFHTRY